MSFDRGSAGREAEDDAGTPAGSSREGRDRHAGPAAFRSAESTPERPRAFWGQARPQPGGGDMADALGEMMLGSGGAAPLSAGGASRESSKRGREERPSFGVELFPTAVRAARPPLAPGSGFRLVPRQASAKDILLRRRLAEALSEEQPPSGLAPLAPRQLNQQPGMAPFGPGCLSASGAPAAASGGFLVAAAEPSMDVEEDAEALQASKTRRME
jgi:hypothetical protein